MPQLTLVFDLDGTLIDTAPDLAAAANHVLRHAGLQPVPGDSIRLHVGHGALAMIRSAAASQGRTFTDGELNALFDVFIDYYSANIAVESAPYPGLVAALDRAQSRGAILAVCTNKQERHAVQVLEELGLADRFAAIIGRDSLDAYKPDPRHLTGTIARAAGCPDRAIMIGDTETDIATAKAAGVPVIAVSFGYGGDGLERFAPDAIIDHFDALDASVAALVG